MKTVSLLRVLFDCSRRLALVVATLLALGHAGAATNDAADALRARHAALAEQLRTNQFQRPLVLESTQTSGDLKGDIHAVVDHPFTTVDAALRGADRWCDVLMLHLNVKHCRASEGATDSSLAVSIGRKHDQPLSDAHRLDFHFQVTARTPDYLHVLLSAPDGPLGTRDYRIAMEVVALDDRHSFMHMSYSYGYGMAARIAMQGYLSTLGSGKVGFSVVGRQADGRPVHVGNVRGVVERNTMRYYLAIDAYLASLAAPPDEQLERRLRGWFAATERYPLQLHELEQDEYLAMKRKEIRRPPA